MGKGRNEPAAGVMARQSVSEAIERAGARGGAPVDAGLDRLSYWLDQAFRIPGTDIRFGLDPIISFLVPVAGDTVTSLMSAYIVLMSVRHGLPKIVIARMIFNVAADYLIGAIPFVGDMFDFAWKANKKNMRLLEIHAQGEGRATWTDWIWVFALLALLGVFIVGMVTLIYFALSAVGL